MSVKIPKIIAGDIVSMVVVIATLIVFVAVPIRNTGLHDMSSLIVLANYNVDDGSHLGLINIRLHNNVATTSGNNVGTNINNGISYPSGWPATNASIIQAFNPSIQTGSATLSAYVFIKIFWLLFLVYIFTRTIFTICRIFVKKPLKIAGLLWVGFSSFLFTAWFLVDPFFYGFFSFLPQLITIPLFVLSIMQLASTEKKKEDLLSQLIVPVTLGVGAAFTWLLLFPIFMLVILMCLINRSAKNGLRIVVNELINNITKYLLFYIMTFAALFAQLSMILGSSKNGLSTTFIQSLLLNGGVSSYPVGFYTLVLIGLVLFIIFAKIKKNINIFTAAITYVLVMLGFASFVYILQQYKLFGNVYYYFKILNSVTIVGIIFSIAGIAIIINILQSKTSRYIAVSLTIIASLLALQFAYPNAPLAEYIKGKRAISSSVDQQIFKILNNDATQSNYNKQAITIFYPENNPVLNEVASTLVQSNRPNSSCYTGLKNASFLVSLKDYDPRIISEYCRSNSQIIYYVDQSFVQSIKDKIAAQNLNSKVVVLPIAN